MSGRTDGALLFGPSQPLHPVDAYPGSDNAWDALDRVDDRLAAAATIERLVTR